MAMNEFKECAFYLTTQILTENIVNIRKEMLGTTEKEREEMAKEILKCAVKILLYDYTPEELYLFADRELLKKMKMLKIYELCVNYAKKNNSEERALDIKKDDFKYLTKIVYPDFYAFRNKKTKKAEILSNYTQFLEGKKKLPAGYFRLGPEGEERLLICMNYILIEKLNFFSLEDLYLTFADKKEAKRILNRYRLTDCKFYPDIKNPLDFMYNSIPAEQRDEDLLNELKERQKYGQVSRKKRKKYYDD